MSFMECLCITESSLEKQDHYKTCIMAQRNVLDRLTGSEAGESHNSCMWDQKWSNPKFCMLGVGGSSTTNQSSKT